MGSSNCFPHFNPRAREGRDFITFERCLDLRYFNPRAREGRDRMVRDTAERRCNFNPRAREGRDILSSMRSDFLMPFQSTRP